MQKDLSSSSSKAIATWLMIGVAMLIVQILLGGVTRLTGSGLSITEWDVVTGSFPPMNAQQWVEKFDKYRQTPQYQLLNSDFTLKDFKFIFFWEWFHRFWARLMGVVFLIPFIVFLVQKRFSKDMIKPMLILFLLGALQGAVGWIMVASGLTGDAIYVKPTRLALHFIFALGLLCYTYWFALRLRIPAEKKVVNNKARHFNIAILIVLVVQLLFGALMAGHKAATAAPTWPDINGSMMPKNMFGNNEGLLNLIDNRITIHFVHRGLAYLLLVLIIAFTVQVFRIKGSALFNKGRIWPLILVSLQVVSGIFTVLSSIHIAARYWGDFEWLAQLHQLIAMCLLLSLIWTLFMIKKGLPTSD